MTWRHAFPDMPALIPRRITSEVARVVFQVEKLPEGALPTYDKDPWDTCYDTEHDGFMGPKTNCPNPECIVDCVQNS